MQKISDKKNILNKILIIMALLILSVVSVNAASWTLPDSIFIGSNSQERNQFTTTGLVITNTDNLTPITNIAASFTSTIAGFTSSNFNITTSGIPAQIDGGNSTTITVQGFVPIKFNSGERQIGTLAVTSVSGGVPLSKTIPVFMNAASNLDIGRITISVDGDDERVSQGDTVDVKRGQAISITIPVENVFSSSDDISINDITIEIDSSNNIDLDDDQSVGDLGPRDEDEATFNFEIPQDADDGREKVTITIDGEDDNGAIHTSILTFDFDVEVKSQDIQIISATAQSGGFCQGQIGTINMEIENTGTRDLTRAMVYVNADDFNFTKRTTDITLDEGDRKTLSFQIPVSNNMRVGSYLVVVETYYQLSSSSKTDTEEVIVNVRNCIQSTVTPPPAITPVTNTTFEIIPQLPTSGNEFGVTVTKKSLTSDWVYVGLLIAGCIIVVLLIILILRTGRTYY